MRKITILICTLTVLVLHGCTLIPSETLNDQTIVDSNTSMDSQIEIDTPEPNLNVTKTYVVSSVNQLRIRTAPNTSSSILGYIDKNDAVAYIDKVGNYYKTVYKENTAYVHQSYCTLMKINVSEDKIERAIDLGCTLLGYPYVWGSQRYHWGNGKLNSDFVPGEFDCSALVQYIYFLSNGTILDLTTRTQVYNGVEVKNNELSRGDLMFFTNSSRKNLTGTECIGHVGIYIGNNYILHTASDHAVIEPISNTRWSYFITARRVV